MTTIVREAVRPPGRMIALGGLLAIFASGCASEADLSSLRREQRDLARRIADTRADVESLRGQLARVRAQVEDGGSRPRATAPAPSTDIEERLRALESSSSRPPDPAPGAPPPTVPPGDEFGTGAPAAPPPAPPPASIPVAETGTPVSVELDMGRSTNEGYRAGLTQYQRGDTQEAVQTLRAAVNKNPKNELVPYAQYWIGESYYGQGKYNEAILAYNEVLVGFPKSDRVPAALLRQASAFAELGDKIDARLILQKLISEYPQSPEAARARKQLLALGS
ncbi:MAG: tol-pal system protein YbgF [Deltaproteobacteria bacterium]|nr:tol-pal system protein YbgF [Deltaproteobacteria bacterium]